MAHDMSTKSKRGTATQQYPFLMVLGLVLS